MYVKFLLALFLLGSYKFGNSTMDHGSVSVSWIRKDCAILQNSLGHEIGHQFGCGHNIEDGKNYFYPHGHGHFIEDDSVGYGTIMTYTNERINYRINYYSNPRYSEFKYFIY